MATDLVKTSARQELAGVQRLMPQGTPHQSARLMGDGHGIDAGAAGNVRQLFQRVAAGHTGVRMERRTLQGHLLAANAHIADCAHEIALLGQLTTDFEREGRDAGLVRRTLEAFQDVQRLEIERRDTLRQELQSMK